MLRALLALLAGLCFSLSVQAAPPFVWFSVANGVYQVDGETNTITRELTLRAEGDLAADSQGNVWMVSGHELVKVDSDGVTQFATNLQALGVTRKAFLAVDPYDDSLWVADDKNILLLDASGALLAVAPAPSEDLRRISIGLDQNLWVLTNKRLRRYSVTGAVVADHDYREFAGASKKQFVVDDLSGVLWLGGSKDLVQLDLETMSEVLQRIRLPDVIRDLALQPDTGDVWVLTKDTLLAYDVSGQLVNRIDLDAHSLKGGAQLELDPLGDSVWIMHGGGVARFSADGQLLTTIGTRQSPKQITGTPFAMLPQLTLLAPADGALTNNPKPRFLMSYDALCNDGSCDLTAADLPNYTLSAELNGSDVGSLFSLDLATGLLAYTPTANLPEGVNVLSAQMRDGFGHLSNTVTSAFTIDTQPPIISVDAPLDGAQTNVPETIVRGHLNEVAILWLNDEAVTVASDGRFEHRLNLNEGVNHFALSATDRAGNSASRLLAVVLDTEPPSPVDAEQLHVSVTSGDAVTLNGAGGSVAAGTRVHVTNLRTGETFDVVANSDGSFGAKFIASPGDGLSVVVFDEAGNASAPTTLTVVGGSGSLPPDPAAVAPPNDTTAVTQFASSTAFLFSGSNPIQTGVVPGAIESQRATVLRGRVLGRDNQPLPGVTVTVLGHPEYGQTMSRADGMFDLAANGGGYLTLDYRKAGYLPLQRRVQTPWKDYAWAEDVVLVAFDPKANSVDLGGGGVMQVAQGSAVEDSRGRRRATVVFPSGVRGEAVMPDGSRMQLSTVTVRATEYTVGENGPKAMPGALPATSGYTYAVELSVDEVVAAGAKEVRFDRPVYVYVNNFIGFPVGGIVPAGWYDRDRAAWIPSENGRVIAVLSTASGYAELDVDGSGQPADAATLMNLGITDEERARLAVLFNAGQSLWRTPAEHFTPWDYNWPYGPPEDAEPPGETPAEPKDDVDDTDCEKGSIIECQNQVLGESVPIVGTPYTLNYRSNRVPGRKANFTLRVPLTGALVPASLKRVLLDITIAGQRITREFAPNPNQSHVFVWDGRDGFGRRVNGVQLAKVTVGYVYNGVYYRPAEFARSFSVAGSSGEVVVGDAGNEVVLRTTWERKLGLVDTGALGLGAWTIDALHFLDPNDAALYQGDGIRRSVDGFVRTIASAAGNGKWDFGGDGGPATDAALSLPHGVAVGPDGAIFIADRSNNRVRRVGTDGVITTIAGTGGAFEHGIDGIPATQSIVDAPAGVAVGGDGAVFIAETDGGRIRRVGVDGIISTVAGVGTVHGFSGDGGPARDAVLYWPWSLALARDGSLYFVDLGNYRVRRIGPDGVISTVAGNGQKALSDGFSGDGRPATEVSIEPSSVAIGPEGDLYISGTPSGVFRVGADGLIKIVAGTGFSGFSGDGGLATNAMLRAPEGICFDSAGNLYIADSRNRRIRRVSSNGIITTIAGGDPVTTGRGDGGPANYARFLAPFDVAVANDGALFVADVNDSVVRVVSSRFGEFADGSIRLSSDDGSEYHVFESSGRHLRTMDSATGALRRQFSYDSQGFVVRIEDGDGNVTHIERDGGGRPVAFVAPDGQRTALSLDSNGYLATIANPAGETHRMTYTGEGLLTRFAEPMGNASTFAYDAQGRLAQTSNPVGGGWALTREELSTGRESSLSSAEGLVTRYRVEQLPAGGSQRINTYPDGTSSQVRIGPSGERTTEAADGTVSFLREGPDPRFGMGAPVASERTVTTPAGLVFRERTVRTATLADTGNLFSHTELGETLDVNGRAFSTRFETGSRTYTYTSPMGRVRAVSVDDQGRPIRMAFADLEPSTLTYDARGRLVQVASGTGGHRITSYAYDTQGSVAAVTDPLSRTTVFDHDPAGRLVRQTWQSGRSLAFSYDANGNLAALTPPGREAHLFDYTAANQEAEYVPPSLDGVESITRSSYDRDKRLTRIELPSGEALSYSYDSLGLPSSVMTSHGTYSYDYDSVTGRLIKQTAPDGSALDYTWDGFLLRSEVASGAVAGTVSRSYDNNFWVRSLAVNGVEVGFDYDADGYLIQAGELSLDRDSENGLLTGTTLGVVDATYSYNGFGEPTEIAVAANSAPLITMTFSRDELGRITQKEEVIGGVTTNELYSYDTDGRLSKVVRDGIDTTWEYDANGNRTKVNGVEIASYDGQDRLLTYGAANYAHTANGDRFTKEEGGVTTEYEYDAFGSLLKVELPGGVTVDYLIDARHRRIGKRVNGHLVQGFLYQDLLRPAAEMDDQGNVVARFVYGGKINVPEYMVKGGVKYRFVTDQLGSVRLVVDSVTGRVEQRMDYNAWGKVLYDSNPGFQPFGFAGGLYDRDTGLVRFGARDYDPTTGRWLGKDPIGFSGGETSLYSYVGGNPISRIDPTGKIFFVPALIGAVLGADGAAILGGTAALVGAGIWMSRPKNPPDVGPPGGWIQGPRRGRKYCPDGTPEYDIDKPHQGNPTDHVHEWPGGVREEPGRPVSPVPSPDNNSGE